MKKRPFTLVVQGGSMRGIYAAGVLDAFMEEGLEPSLAFGTSAGSLMLANFLSGDYLRAKKTVLLMASDRRFMSPVNLVRKGSFFDFDYLFDEVPSFLPYDKEKLLSAPIRFYAVATELESCSSTLFEKGESDFFTGLAASCSLPLLSVPVKARGKHYLDGGIVAPIALHEALRMKEGPLIVISTQARGYRKKARVDHPNPHFRKVFEQFPLIEDLVRHPEKVYNPLFDELDSMNDKGDLLAIYPSKDINIKATEREPEVLSEIYSLGHADAKREMRSILSFLSVTRTAKI